MFQARRYHIEKRSEFERNLNLLREKIADGKVRLPVGMDIEGIQDARLLPNGRINLLTINEMVRCLANAIDSADRNIIEKN